MSQSRTLCIGMDVHKDSLLWRTSRRITVPRSPPLVLSAPVRVTPRELTQFLGLLPAEYTSAERRRQGSIPNAGTTHARRVLVEGAWASRSPAKVRRHLHLRLETQPKIIQDISWKAQGRLCQRYRRLVARGTHSNVATGAIARASTGFLWAMATQVPSTP